MKPNFITSMLSGIGGGISTKRVVLVFFTLLFAYQDLYNMHTGKAPNPLYQEQTYEILLFVLLSVFGEKALDVIPLFKNRKTSTSTTVISPETPTVTTVTKESEPNAK